MATDELAKLFIGGLPREGVDEAVLEKELNLSQFGTVTDVNIVRGSDGKSRGFGFVTYEDLDSAEGAFNTLNGTKLFDSEIEVKQAVPRAISEEDRTEVKLFVGGLHPDVDEEMIETEFNTRIGEDYGVVAKVVIARKKENLKCKGFGFVVYNDYDLAERAFHIMEGHVIMGRRISVKFTSGSLEEARHRGIALRTADTRGGRGGRGGGRGGHQSSGGYRQYYGYNNP